MKIKWIVASVSLALCVFVSCSKKDSDNPGTPSGPAIDSSKCLLTEVKYEALPTYSPYHLDNFSIAYDSLNRIKQKGWLYSYEPGKVTVRGYVNNYADSNLTNRIVYTLDNNGRIASHIEYTYFHPKNENDIWGKHRMEYTYDTEGYLTGLKDYSIYSTTEIIYQDIKFTYQNGNMVQKELSHYNQYSANNDKAGTDTTYYTYDNTSWYPEATYLYEINDYRPFKTDKPNKNNVTGIQCKVYNVTSLNNHYKTIQYAYIPKGPKLEKVTMTATTTSGLNINSSISFGYKCN